MQRILALDVGEKRIGIAVSDLLGITAQGLQTYVRSGDIQEDVRHIVNLSDSYQPVKLVFGMPRNMDGSYGQQAAYTRAFAEQVLAAWDGEHDFFDERLTSRSAERVLIEADLSRAKRKTVIDKLAAVIILQGYLDAHGS